jgi:hypothetical protein
VNGSFNSQAHFANFPGGYLEINGGLRIKPGGIFGFTSGATINVNSTGSITIDSLATFDNTFSGGSGIINLNAGSIINNGTFKPGNLVNNGGTIQNNSQ